MSTIVVLTPVVIGSWPAIAAAAAGAAAALGLTINQDEQEFVDVEEENAVELEIPESEVLAQNIVTGKEIVLEKEGVKLRITRDDRGRCVVNASGTEDKKKLEVMAKDFVQKMTQCYVYNQTMQELKNKDFQVVNQEVEEDGTVRINVRRWVD